jgi:transcriptional regulator with GAF, ATPase, and Fis domain
MAGLLSFLEDSLFFFQTLLSNPYALLIITSISFSLKLYIATVLVKYSLCNKGPKRLLILLLIMLTGSLMSDSAWILHFIGKNSLLLIDSRFITFFIRTAWAFTVIQYQSLALFIQNLITQNNIINRTNILFIILSSFFLLFGFGCAFFEFNHFVASRAYTLQQAQSFYILVVLMPICLTSTIIKLRGTTLPRILKKQLKILIWAIIIPHVLSDCLQLYPFNFSPHVITGSFAFVGISTMLLTAAIYYSMKKVMGLRFLNFNSHVKSISRYNFIDGFKIVLDQLSKATTAKELENITKSFFKEAFDLPTNKIQLHARTPESIMHIRSSDIYETEFVVENFLDTATDILKQYMREHIILIYDEIDFTNFYQKNESQKAILTFLDTLEADIFLPIYNKNTIIAYIIIDRNARQDDQFYSKTDHDEMIIFSQYIGNIINLLQQRNLENLLQQEKELKEELYQKHQEANQYKESIKSFLKQSKQKEIGIIFYKSGSFAYGNQTAKELISTNLNTHLGHPVTKKLRHAADLAKQYNSPQSTVIINDAATQLMISAVPHLEKQSVIIIIYYPDLTDVIKKQINLLKDPTSYDYLLYLETTKSGKLINQLIPGSGEIILNFKMDLMRAALGSKITLLDMPENDLLPTVELLHHISMRKTLHVLKLNRPSNNHDIAIKLFGINPIFGTSLNKPLLEKADSNDTLFIQNIHFLSLETQEYLTQLIQYGFYRILKSDQKIPCTVRIICSTNQDLEPLIKENKFSSALFNELVKTTLVFPSLLTLPEQEVNELVEGFTAQSIKDRSTQQLLELTNKDKSKLINQRPTSLFDLKCKVQQLLKQKTQETPAYNNTEFNPAYTIQDPELIEIAQLGKHALRDQKIMAILWSKFDKNQNKMADFLGVNRSSINRRCKQYNLR